MTCWVTHPVMSALGRLCTFDAYKLRYREARQIAFDVPLDLTRHEEMTL